MNSSRQCFIKITILLGTFLYVYIWLFIRQWNFMTFPSFLPQRKAFSSESIQQVQTDWQEVTGSEYYFSVYSAYHILGRSPSEVLVIGTAPTFTNETIFCRIYSQKGWNQSDPTASKYTDVPGSIETMEEHLNRTYNGVFFHCPFTGNIKLEMVSILFTNQTKPSNMVPIHQKDEVKPARTNQYDFKISLCVHPIFSYNKAFRLIEWIEFYKLMGVEQITLYNVSIGPDASCILQDIMDGNDPLIKMNVHPWHKNPIKKSNLIRSGNCAECALSAGSNDCLYRHRGRVSKYMVFVDLDEFILPRENIAKDYPQLMDFLATQHPEQNFGQYIFRNGFFLRNRPDDPLLETRCLKFEGDPLKSRICRESLMMSKVWRQDYHPYRVRSKYIIKPEGVRQAGTHFASVMESGYATLEVPENVAFSRHYRNNTWGLIFGLEHMEIDRAPLEFGLELVSNLAKRMRYFNQKCNLKF